jgi:alpha-glucosidase
VTSALLRLDRATGALPLPDGVELRIDKATLRITALTEGILRVRIAPSEGLPQDESWAVLPQIQRRSVQVAHVPAGGGRLHFTTAELDVTAKLDPLHLTIADSTGHVLLDDAPARPVTFTGPSFRVWKASPPDEHYYGLGDKPGRLDRRGRAFRMWNTDDLTWSEASDLLYKSIPFLIGLRGGRAWGMLLDNTWRSVFDFGVSVPDIVSFGAEGGPLDFYVLAGPEPKAVLGRYAMLTGTASLPPLWALGFHQSRYSYTSQARVLAVAAEHRRRRIPVDAIWLDIGYQDRNRPFTVDKREFPDLAGMAARLAEDGIRTVAITDLHIAHQPRTGYAPYDTGLAGDHFLRNADGSLFIGESWPGASVFPDFTQARTRAWWGNLYRDFYLHHGIAGFWNDMNEPSVRDGPGHTMPLDVQHRIDEPGQLV